MQLTFDADANAKLDSLATRNHDGGLVATLIERACTKLVPAAADPEASKKLLGRFIREYSEAAGHGITVKMTKVPSATEFEISVERSDGDVGETFVVTWVLDAWWTVSCPLEDRDESLSHLRRVR